MRGTTCSFSRDSTTRGSRPRPRSGAAREGGEDQQDLGREGFEAYVGEWLSEYGGKIMLQFRRIGASLDYGRTRFTMDEAYSAP